MKASINIFAVVLMSFTLNGCLGGEDSSDSYGDDGWSGGGGDLGVKTEYPYSSFNALTIVDIPLGEKNEVVVRIFDADDLISSPFQDDWSISPIFADTFLASDETIEIPDLPTDRPLLIMLLTRNSSREITYVGQMTKKLRPGELTLVTVPMKQFGAFVQNVVDVVFTDNSSYYVDDELHFEITVYNSTLFNLSSANISIRSLTSGVDVQSSWGIYDYADFLTFTSKSYGEFGLYLDDEFSGPITLKATIEFDDYHGDGFNSYSWEQTFTIESY